MNKIIIPIIVILIIIIGIGIFFVLKPKRPFPPEEGFLGKEVSFKASDGVSALGYLSKPAGSGKFPAIILLHGGFSSKTATYNLGNQEHAKKLKENGYVALAVHYRDSGFGLEEINDVIGAIDYLETLSYIDKDRIALFGSSHGAYMSLLTASKVGNRVKAVVDNFGFTNMITHYENVIEKRITCHTDKQVKEHIRRTNTYYGGSPESNLELYKEISPYYNVGKITAPILIIHGKKDCSVPIENQVYAFRDELKKAGKTYEIKIYEDGPHGFIYKKTPEAKDAGKVTLQFLDKYLR